MEKFGLDGFISPAQCTLGLADGLQDQGCDCTDVTDAPVAPPTVAPTTAPLTFTPATSTPTSVTDAPVAPPTVAPTTAPPTFTPATSTPVESAVSAPVSLTTRSQFRLSFTTLPPKLVSLLAPVSTATKQTITFPLKSPPTTATNIIDYLGRSREQQHNEQNQVEKKPHKGLLYWLFQNPAQTGEEN
jgi:hypothetical protein